MKRRFGREISLDETQARLMAVLPRGPMSFEELLLTAGTARSSTHRALAKLAEDNVIAKEKTGIKAPRHLFRLVEPPHTPLALWYRAWNLGLTIPDGKWADQAPRLEEIARLCQAAARLCREQA